MDALGLGLSIGAVIAERQSVAETALESGAATVQTIKQQAGSGALIHTLIPGL